jgi:hypothetical protein
MATYLAQYMSSRANSELVEAHLCGVRHATRTLIHPAYRASGDKARHEHWRPARSRHRQMNAFV